MLTQVLESGNGLFEKSLFLQPQIPEAKAWEMNQTLGIKLKPDPRPRQEISVPAQSETQLCDSWVFVLFNLPDVISSSAA